MMKTGRTVNLNFYGGVFYDAIVDISNYSDNKAHTFHVRATDEYGNVSTGMLNFRYNYYFNDVKYDAEKAQINLGENWSKYVYTFGDDEDELLDNLKNRRTYYYPSQRTLSYYYGEDSTGEQLTDTGNTRFSNNYVMVADRNDIEKNIILDCSDNLLREIEYDLKKDEIELDSNNKYLISSGSVYGGSYSPTGQFAEVTTDVLPRVEGGVTGRSFSGEYVVFALKLNPLSTRLIRVKE